MSIILSLSLSICWSRSLGNLDLSKANIDFTTFVSLSVLPSFSLEILRKSSSNGTAQLPLSAMAAPPHVKAEPTAS